MMTNFFHRRYRVRQKKMYKIMNVICAHDFYFVQHKDTCGALGPLYCPKMHCRIGHASIWHCNKCHQWILPYGWKNYDQMFQVFCQRDFWKYINCGKLWRSIWEKNSKST
jgi:hypothetical protein